MNASAKKAAKPGGGKKGKKGKPGRPKLLVSVEGLDEKQLKAKLETLDKELVKYRDTIASYKKESEYYRSEIESCQHDTAEYIGYLEGKKLEKQNLIAEMTERNQREYETYVAKRKAVESEYSEKMTTLRSQIKELEVKIKFTNQDILALSDLVSRRTRHEADVAKLKSVLIEMKKEHEQKLSAVERELLESRMRLQREADAKVKAVETAAHEQAGRYLKAHAAKLEHDNRQLEQGLRQAIQSTREQLIRKETLERKNKDLERERKMKDDVTRIRVNRAVREREAEERRKNRSRERRISGGELRGGRERSSAGDGDEDSTTDDEYLC